MKRVPRVAIVGAGLDLAAELVAQLVERVVELEDLRVLGGEDTVGEVVEVGPARLRVEHASPESLANIKAAVFCGDGVLAADLVEPTRRGGALVVDATPFSRRIGGASLIVPEVNASLASTARGGTVLASPMPATVGIAIALAAVRSAAEIARVHVTSFESASQRGATGPEELSRQTVALVQGQGHDREEFPEQLAFNLRPQIPAGGSDWATEERAIAVEVAAVLGEPRVPAIATVVRAPVFFGAAAAIHAELTRPVAAEEIREHLRSAPGILLAGSLPAPEAGADEDAVEVDERPGPVEVTGSEAIHVARVRVDPDDPRMLALWIAFDDVRKGIAANVVGILEATRFGSR